MPAQRSTRVHPSTAAAAVALGVALASAAPARAALIDEPPKLFTFKLDDPKSPRFTLLEAFREAGVDHSTSLRRYLAGQYGRWGAAPWQPLTWRLDRRDPAAAEAPRPAFAFDEDGAMRAAPGEERLFGFEPPGDALSLSPSAAPTWLSRIDPTFTPVLASTGASFASNGFDALWSLPPSKPVRDWRCRRRPVQFARIGGESDWFPLVHCNGSVEHEALDRLTLMARVPEVPRPGELLPDEPDPDAARRGEWVAGVRLVHPRLVWVIQRIADAFPWRPIYVYSGYRPSPEGRANKPGGHHSMHSEARAMDIGVMGIPNATLFKLCRTLWDVGCGFYPNSKFVHVDVRRPGSGHPFWIDASGPGEPSRYVDSWPGVVDGGGLSWDSRSSAEASCVERRSAHVN
jgi:hypothetical protein